MAAATDQQLELAAFLRTRRATLLRDDFGLPQLRGGRRHGLRREEVAFLVGVSVTWYTWLEQGRNANPSRQVVDALARELKMTAAEHGYLIALAGYGPRVAEATPWVPPHLQRLIDGWTPAPAFAITSAWDIVAWNRAYAALYPAVAHASPGEKNLLWVLFKDPYVRRMLPDWETDSSQFVAEFRADHAAHASNPQMKALVRRLRAASEDFDLAWTRHDIERFVSRTRRFHHPEVGDIRLEVHRLVVADDPTLNVIVYSPVPGETDHAAFARLVAMPGTTSSGVATHSRVPAHEGR